MPKPDLLPLIFDFFESVFTDDYSVHVRVRGKAVVLTEKDGDISVHGVVPAGPTGSGDSLESAMRSYRSNFKETLSNLGRWAGSWEEFRSTFDEYFGATPAHLERLWAEAIESVKSSDRTNLGLPMKDTYPARSVEIRGATFISSSPEENTEDIAIAA